MIDENMCRCGCKKPGNWLMTGVDFSGIAFVNEPACESAAQYCTEAAAELDLPFIKTLVTPNSK